MFKFRQWLESADYVQYAPNGKFFTIAPTWGNFKFVEPRPNESELKVMAQVLTQHGFPTRVAKTGDQWVFGNYGVPEEVDNAWNAAVDAAAEAMENYRSLVGRKITYRDNLIGTRHYYDDKIQSILDQASQVRDDPAKVRQLFHSLEPHEKAVLVHDAGYFTPDGQLTPAALNVTRHI